MIFEKKRKMSQRNYAKYWILFNILKHNVCIIIYLLQLLSLDDESFLNKLNDLFEQWGVFSTLGLVLPCPQCWRTLLTLQLWDEVLCRQWLYRRLIIVEVAILEYAPDSSITPFVPEGEPTFAPESVTTVSHLRKPIGLGINDSFSSHVFFSLLLSLKDLLEPTLNPKLKPPIKLFVE